ncbi:response regulator [Phycisphaera mikurensis]|nr:response regulator [Phycisphaera mikurensis]MBB6442957.1 CheY-like chemotaxis protein [Phycisphaera mikurensis]
MEPVAPAQSTRNAEIPPSLAEATGLLALDTIGEGVGMVEAGGRLAWANATLRGCSPSLREHVLRVSGQAIHIFNTQWGGVNGGSGGMPRGKKFTVQDGERFFEVICSPVDESAAERFGIDAPRADAEEAAGPVRRVVSMVWDATSGKRLQGRIDAIDASGRELARIDNEAVSKLRPAERLKLLQDKIIGYSKELMQFDHFTIRLLDKRTRALEVVIAEGLPREALEIDLYARPEGNGISGYVAATGRSYICHDVEKDPRYVLGLTHSKSSLTVPLNLFGEIVGVYNIESETAGSFDDEDRQFAEIFARYVALALNILDLLVVERHSTSTTLTRGVASELQQPLDAILAEAEALRAETVADGGHCLARIDEHVAKVRRVLHDLESGPNRVLGEADDARDASPQDDRFTGKRVLVADDEPNIRRVVKEVLTRRGCEVQCAKDGYEACMLLEQGGNELDLVISDIKMPYRNGYEIYAAAQRARDGLPVLLMTGFGYDPHHSVVRASQDGLAGVLFKPFKVDAFLEEVAGAVAPASA